MSNLSEKLLGLQQSIIASNVPQMVQYLISIGADIMANNNESVFLAAINHHFEIVRYLVSLGASPSLTSRHQGHEKKMDKALRYINFYNKNQEKRKTLAQKKIYFWWIPICYDPYRESGKRMAMRNWEQTKLLLDT